MTFRELSALGRTLHAVCFIGGNADELAENAAKTFLCERGGDEPCNVCADCKKAQEKIHPDIIYVRENMKDKKYAAGQLRDAVAGANLRPNDGEVKIYVFTEADSLSVICQNTLLKFTEEPPEFVRIIFTAKSADGFLETIKSRFIFINAHENINRPENEIVRNFMSAFHKNDEYSAAATLSKIKTREDLNTVLELISAQIRDLIVSGSPTLIYIQKILMSAINDLQFNPNIALTTTYLTHNIFKNVREYK